MARPRKNTKIENVGIELLKTSEVTSNGQIIGKIEFEGVFVGQNFKTMKQVKAATLEEVMEWFKS